MPSNRRAKSHKKDKSICNDHEDALLLPPELIATVFSFLRASDVGHGMFSCKTFLSVCTTESTAWTLAIAEFDPFCALGKGDEVEVGAGAWRLFDAAGGSWVRVMSALAGRPQACTKCPPSAAGKWASTLFCQCPVRTTRSVSSSSSASSGGFVKRCGEHHQCDGIKRGTCVKINSQVLNRFMFLGKEIWRTVKASKRDHEASQFELQEAIDEAPAFATIAIKGHFKFDSMLFLDQLPVRIVGEGAGAKITFNEKSAIISSPIAIMENLSINMKTLFDPGYYCEGCGGYHGSEEAVRSPAIQVNEDSGFIGIKCKINSEMGTAFLMCEESKDYCKALLMDCTLSSNGPSDENGGGGICVKDHCLLSMYGCTITESPVSLFLGNDNNGLKLSLLQKHNECIDEDQEVEDACFFDPIYEPQIIQPWVDSKWHIR